MAAGLRPLARGAQVDVLVECICMGRVSLSGDERCRYGTSMLYLVRYLNVHQRGGVASGLATRRPCAVRREDGTS